MKRKAFTLAEVLVTLMIIGVIAAITVPSLKRKSDEAEFVAGVLKAYSNLTNAVNRMSGDYGAIGIGSNWTSSTKFMKNLQKYMNVTKKCKMATGEEGDENYDPGNFTECFTRFASYKQLKGTAAGTYFTESSNMFTTADGISYAYLPNTSNSNGYFVATEYAKGIFGRFFVDVNGPKKPNIFGVDSFCFIIVKGKGVIPCGTGKVNDCKKTASGTACAAKVIANKKIDYMK